MQSEHQDNDQVARELLAQMRLIEVARGESQGTWRMLWRTRIRPLCVTFGFIAVTLALMESAGHSAWLAVGGMFCLLAAFEFGPATDQRLDALVGALERNGTLSVGADDKRERPA